MPVMNSEECLKRVFLSFILVFFIAAPVLADKVADVSSHPSLALSSADKGPVTLDHRPLANKEGDYRKTSPETAVASANQRVQSDTDVLFFQKASEVSPQQADQPTLEDKTVNVIIRGGQKEVTISTGREADRGTDLGITFPSDNTTALSSIERSMNLFTVRIRAKFTLWLERSARYIDIMKGILRERKLPEELVFLPIVESGFNCNAYSRARAVGPWQFIEATAKRYGLVVDWWRDERRDPVKSTEAAAAYLRDLYKMFGSWNLALAAYNAGEGKIMRALRTTDADDYWSLLHTKQIRNETKEYVSHFLAATMIAHTPEEYGFSNLVYHEPLEYDDVVINTPLDLEVIAECAEASLEEIRELNPELRRWSTPLNVGRYTIRIPKGTKDVFTENLSMIPVEERFSFDTYKVKKGEDFRKIANKLNLPTGVILALNDMSGIEHIKAGNEIRIPPKGKFFPDLDDRMSAKKVSYTKKSPDKQKSSLKPRSRTVKETKRKTKDKIKARKI